MADQTIGLPQLLILLVLGALAIRYFFFSSGNTSSQNRSTTSANNIRAREADVERIQQMFPQVSRRSIMWDLQRNGGNVVATTERILSGRGLEVVSLARFFGPAQLVDVLFRDAAANFWTVLT
jgi:coupling of ubiquitin conjugation to ER degradation protein 1